MTVRIGFFGAGLIAGFHARSLAAAQKRHEHTLAAVYDAVGTRADEFAGWTGASVCASEAELLDAVDAVYVCTWTSEHERLVDLAVDAGKPVFCEKPLATDLAGAQRMAARVAGVINQVGLVLRTSPSLALLEQLVKDDASGRLISVTFHDDQVLPVKGDWYQSEWRSDPARAGSGVLMEHSIHDIDALERLGGPAASVSAVARYNHGIDGIEDAVAASFSYAAGGVATLTTVWHDIPERLNDRRIEVTCERFYGMLSGDWIGPLRWQRPGESPQELQGEALVAAAPKQHNPDGVFVDAVANNRPATPTFADALRAHVVVDAAYRSAAQGGAVVPI